MRILLINPNTTASVTDRVAEHVRRIAGPSVEIVPATGRFGARYIASRAAAAIAGHAALDALAEYGSGCDAVYLACFGDPGLLALREVAAVPVVGMAEAACREAAGRGRFSIVTGGTAWRPMLAELVTMLGLSAHLAGIRTTTATGGAIARDPDAALGALIAACRACATDDGADTVILGGAGLAGLAERIRPMLACRILCSVEAGTRAAIAAAAGPVVRGAAATTESVGLAPALARLLAAGH
ncbi:aspartate/glutamate racemase family protein [uncultured Methylobacterium sp.]|uniref:aspartate/glutamate racemase family protein n=1 Tax=uncultured Methylobacterium sp. TaxID=157278 RepID=UPI0035CC6EC5